MTAEIGYVQANGLRFAYLSEGSGPLVLLLHGFPDTAHTWDLVRPRIAKKGYRAVSPFMRGYHPTAVPSADPDTDTTAQDTVSLIDALGAQEAIVIGHDWGAATAYSAAALDPKRVKKLFAVGVPHPATLKVTFAKVWGVRHFFLYKMPGAASRFASNDFAALPAICRRWSPGWTMSAEDIASVKECFSHRDSLNSAFGYYRTLRIGGPSPLGKKRISVPTVVFAGLDDPNLEVEDYRRAKKKFDGEYVIEEVPGGHFLHREHPDVFADKLLAHL